MFIKAAIQSATVQPLISNSNTSQPGYNFAVVKTVHDQYVYIIDLKLL